HGPAGLPIVMPPSCAMSEALFPSGAPPSVTVGETARSGCPQSPPQVVFESEQPKSEMATRATKRARMAVLHVLVSQSGGQPSGRLLGEVEPARGEGKCLFREC